MELDLFVLRIVKFCHYSGFIHFLHSVVHVLDSIFNTSHIFFHASYNFCGLLCS